MTKQKTIKQIFLQKIIPAFFKGMSEAMTIVMIIAVVLLVVLALVLH
ncbi:MAG: hypothetical protein K0U12_01825 [Gammaproteobacteria bacterium]|nr:hypothetical protein [Gammaproteobacteria bacterium]